MHVSVSVKNASLHVRCVLVKFYLSNLISFVCLFESMLTWEPICLAFFTLAVC